MAKEQSSRRGNAPSPTPLLGMIENAADALARYNAALAAAVRNEEPISPASEWLLDNYYLVEEQIAAVREDLPVGYGRELAWLETGPMAGYPRIYEAVVALVAHTDARVDEQYLMRFIDGFQDESPLSIGELWAVPIMLRVALVENVCRLARAVVENHRAGHAADLWADRLLLAAQDRPDELRALIDELNREPLVTAPAFFTRLSQRLQGGDVGVDAITAWLDRRLVTAGVMLEEAGTALGQSQAADQVSIANSFTAIRFLDAYEWHAFFEQASIVEQILAEDPAGVYPVMDFNSRDHYRHALEMLARRCPFSEIEAAEAAVSWAMQGMAEDAADPVKGHVGYYLVRAGRYKLERSVDYRPRKRERIYRGPLRLRGLFFWGVMTLAELLMLGLIVAFAWLWGAPPLALAALALLALLPASEVAVNITNRLSNAVFPPRKLPKLDYQEPVADAHRTLVVVPALFSSVKATRSVIDHLEVTYLGNRDDNILFAVLGDLKGGPEPHADGDASLVEAAVVGIEMLNKRYLEEHGREPFGLFIRGRTFNKAENTWMGWERKRGALLELVRSLRGSGETSFTHRHGDQSFLDDVTFVITLDADTVLPHDGARKLISTIAHPLNRARCLPTDERVKFGYGLVQPRVAMTLPSARKSFYAWLHSGTTGIDPYAGAVSDTYQDVFSEGSFTGKGIFEVSVFAAVLEGRIAENSILSHDLLEGSLLRTALASDVEVLDAYPPNYLSNASRVHRWVRGDWQTLPWLFPLVRTTEEGRTTRNPLSPLHRWKILDNLRRSLLPFAMVLFMALSWRLLPDDVWAWPLVVTGLVLFPVYFGFIDALLFRPIAVSYGTRLRSASRDFARDSARMVLTIAVLPHEAWYLVDAIIRALWRMFVSRKLLLEWETAADVERRSGSDLSSFVRKMWKSSVAGVLLLVAGTAPSLPRMAAAVPLALLWLAGPWLAWRASLVLERERAELNPQERLELRLHARRTWRFYETFVTQHTHWLAPDNFQEDPGGVVAMRTSPTNIGLQLLACLTAYDLGYVNLHALVERVADTLHTMVGLERFRGHFYNWYDLVGPTPLPPNYVSTVDSGNLAGHLLVLRIGLLEASEAPLLGAQLLEGIADTTRLAIEDLAVEGDAAGETACVQRAHRALEELLRAVSLENAPEDLGEWHALLERLSGLAQDAEAACTPLLAGEAGSAEMSSAGHLVDGPPRFPATPAARVHVSIRACVAAVEDAHSFLGQLAPWAALVPRIPSLVAADPRAAALAPLTGHVPSLVGLAEGLEEARAALVSIAEGPPGYGEATHEAVSWATAMLDGLDAARPLADEQLGRLRLNALIAREMWEHMDFRMLFDERRLLFPIGFNTAEGRLDTSFYDMLASECRLASFLAIAKGDVPQEHWFRLGRSLAGTTGNVALISWSASMFEYLMPLLVMRSWPTTLLDDTYAAVVHRQIQYGAELGVPWGVSESAFNAKDAILTYQYQAFGVPGLGLKRGLSDDIVIAPYATVLALPIAPHSVIANLRALAAEGARGRYGFYEAIDYTPGRVPARESRAIVKAYFAHHQGMSLVAFGNELTDYAMQRRFHHDPMVASAELLLQERVPAEPQLTKPHIEEVENVRSVRELPPPVTRSYPLADTPTPATHFLSNGSYSVMVTNAGGGYSRWRGVAVSRYREDVTRDCWGQFIYLRDTESGDIWCATHNPVPGTPEEFHVTFSADKAEFRRRDGNLETRTEIAVSPEDDVEIRRVVITNRGREPRTIEATSYFEVALTEQAADQAHKSFSNVFVETDALEEHGAVLFSRRPRSSHEDRVWGFHVIACADTDCVCSYETDRARFLGRLRQSADPRAMDSSGPLSNTVGAVLDPCCAIRQEATVPPGGSARFVFVTGVALTRDAAERLCDKYHDVRSAQRAMDMSWTASQIELRDLGISPSVAVTLQRLASRLLLTDPYQRLKVVTTVENGLGISGLWSIGISGDLPILLVRVDELEHTPLVRQALLAHQYWRHKGLIADLVVLNTRPTAYSDELDDRLRLLLRTGHALQLMDKPGGVFLRRSDQMHPDILNLLLSVARATLEGDSGSIELQLNRRAQRPDDPPLLVPAVSTLHPGTPSGNEPGPAAVPADEGGAPPPALRETARTTQPRPDLMFDNGYGGMDLDAGEYVVVLEPGRVTPAPWVNVIGQPHFGTLVSEAGIGCTWAKNSHENRITTWNNDPVSDGSGEVFYIRDEESGVFWSPTLLPRPATGATHTIRHGRGYSVFESHSNGIGQRLDWFVPGDDPIRVARLTLTNDSGQARKLSVTHLVEWVLGSSRSKAQHLVVTWYDAESEMITAHNHYNPDFPGRPAFVACDRPLASYTASRTEFVGRNRRADDPVAMYRKYLGARSGRYHDNCGALMVGIELEPGESQSVSFFLGQTGTLDEARLLVERYRQPGMVQDSYDAARAEWRDLLDSVTVRSPDPALDTMVNGQLLYQALSCRMWGRTATYQSSGAFGFRDQLQDSWCLVYARPDLLRGQIVEASRHQFPRGDVLHWWQPFSGRGVRTRITDDRHWLPLVTAEYVLATGDASVLDELTAFIEGPEIEEGREDNYLQPAVSEHAATVYEHCCRALDSGQDVGPHGLPLMGGGDWNDGMNRVGIHGTGESIWLAWFLDVALRRFALVCERRGDTERAQDYRDRAARFIEAVERDGWDGSWYRRAYFDDGTPLGSHASQECRIDAIAQAWATVSGSGDRQRAVDALAAVQDHLVRREDKLIALLTPPFDRMVHDPGYIKGYVPGVRENGGQYTHAAIWVALAYLLQGDGDEAIGLLDLINPLNHARSREDADVYKVEPYVVAADVYAVNPHAGRGGWTWYTGAAGWFYRVAVQHVYGLTLLAEDGVRYFTVNPCIPKHWSGFEVVYRFGSAEYRISVDNPRGVNRGVDRINLDGRAVPDLRVPLVDDGGQHTVLVTMLGG